MQASQTESKHESTHAVRPLPCAALLSTSALVFKSLLTNQQQPTAVSVLLLSYRTPCRPPTCHTPLFEKVKWIKERKQEPPWCAMKLCPEAPARRWVGGTAGARVGHVHAGAGEARAGWWRLAGEAALDSSTALSHTRRCRAARLQRRLTSCPPPPSPHLLSPQ